MSAPRTAQPAKLVVGMFMREKSLLPAAADRLVTQFGAMDMVSSWMRFDYTDYYEPEMGGPLWRRMVTFKTLIRQNDLAAVKTATNRIEQTFSEKGRRRINIDPGYLLLERFVLASGKNFSHRIYIDQGIYADLTLIYQKGGFRKLPWTYPDYAAEPMAGFLEKVREKYILDLRRPAANAGEG